MARRVWLGAGLAAVVALFLPGAVLKSLLLSAVAVVAGTALWLDRVRRAVDVEVAVPTRLVRGEVADLEVTVRNGSRLPAPRVRAVVRLHAGGVTPSETVVEVALPGRSQRRLRTDLTAHTRGRWAATPLTIELSDPLGLAVHRFEGRTPAEVVVLPTIVPVRRVEFPAVAPVPEVADERALLADPMAIVGVRPYQPGDPLRSIHWPATAAAGTLVRREVERAWARDLVVVLELDEERYGRGGGARLERAVTVAASVLADGILRQRQPAGMAVSVPRPRGAAAEVATFRVGASRGHLDAMLVHLADVRAHGAVPMDELLARLARREQPGTTVVVVTPEPLSVVGEPASRLRAAGLTPAVLHVGGRRGPSLPRRGRVVTPVLAVEDDVPLTELVL